MESLIIPGTQETPDINFDSLSGKFTIVGRSYASDTLGFYKPINAWIEEYLNDPQVSTILEINVDYFHSVSVKFLTNLIKQLSELRGKNKILYVNGFF